MGVDSAHSPGAMRIGRGGSRRGVFAIALVLVVGLAAILPSIAAARIATDSSQILERNPGSDGRYLFSNLAAGDEAIVGIVFEDRNGNGFLDNNEGRVSDARVTIERVQGGSRSSESDTTDSNGRYRFENLDSGTYIVTVRPPSGFLASSSTRVEVRVTTGRGQVVDFALTRTAAGTATAAAQATLVARVFALPPAQTGAGVFAPPPAQTPARPLAPRRAAAQRLHGLSPRLTRFTMRSVTLLGGGNRVDAAADGAIIAPDRLSMRIVRNDRLQDFIVIGQQGYVQSAETNDQWTLIPYADLRREIELLAPLDALRALRFVEAADEYGEVIVEGVPTTRYVGDVNTLALWEASRDSAEQIAREMQLQVWVGQEDRIIRAERMTSDLLAPISDPSQIPDSVKFDAVFVFSEPERPFTIVAPTIPPAPQGPAQPAAAAQAPGRQTAPAPGPNGTPAGTPGPEGEDPNGAVLPGAVPSQREQDMAGERALVALVTGGQCRTGSVARPPSIQLDLPFRSQRDGTAYAATNSGPASLSMILSGFGIEVSPGDLRALLNSLERSYEPSSTSRIETIARVAERAGLNVVDLYRGTRFNEWTVEGVREMIRRGYPVVTLVQGAVLPEGNPPGVDRDRFVTIIGIDGDELIYHDPAYSNQATGGVRRARARQFEQAWLAASTSRLAAGFSLAPDGRGLLDCGRAASTPGPAELVVTPSPLVGTTVPAVATPLASVPTPTPTPEPPPPEYLFGLPFHPLLLLFWTVLIILLLFLLSVLLRRGPR